MFRKCMLQLCGLAIAMSSGAVALGQSSSFGRRRSTRWRCETLSRPCSSQFNQQSSGGMPGAGRIGLGLDTVVLRQQTVHRFFAGPTVSPYLNLFRVDQNGFQGFNYSTLVQPQLRQQQVNQQQQQQNSRPRAGCKQSRRKQTTTCRAPRKSFPRGTRRCSSIWGTITRSSGRIRRSRRSSSSTVLACCARAC